MLKKRLMFVGVFAAVFTISYLIGTSYKISQDELNDVLKDFRNQTEGIDSYGIFWNNLQEGLPMFVPGFGVGWGAYTALSTGVSYQAITSQSDTHENSLMAIFGSSYGIIELVAYSIAMSESLVFLIALLRRKWKQDVKFALSEIALVSVLLLIASFIESSQVLT